MPDPSCREPGCSHCCFNHLLIKKLNSNNVGPVGSKCLVLGCKCQHYAGPKESAKPKEGVKAA